MPFIPDRRPLVFFSAFGAVYGDNPQGIDFLFRTNPAFRFAQLAAVAAGITSRILISMPQGQTAGNAFGAACQSVLAPAIATWLETESPAHAEVFDLILYTGSFKGKTAGVPVQDATNQETGPEGSAVNIGPSDVSWYVEDCIQNFALAGWKQLWLDAMYTGTHYDTMDVLRTELDRFGWMPQAVGGEAYPLNVDNTLIPSLCVRAPMLALERNYHRTFDPNGLWVAPAGSEMHVIIDDQFSFWSESVGRAKLESFFNRNFVVSMNGGAPAYALQWWREKYGRVSRASMFAGYAAAS